MTRNFFLYLSLVMASLITTNAIAEPATINIEGRVIASPCEVDSDSITKTIALDGGNNFEAKDLQEPESASEWVKFDLTVRDCPAGTSKSTITFSGTADETHPESMYVNTGTAKNVAVELQSHDGLYMFGNGKTYQGSILSDRTFVFRLRSRAFTSNGGVTPGTIQAVVTANFTYQ